MASDRAGLNKRTRLAGAIIDAVRSQDKTYFITPKLTFTYREEVSFALTLVGRRRVENAMAKFGAGRLFLRKFTGSDVKFCG